MHNFFHYLTEAKKLTSQTVNLKEAEVHFFTLGGLWKDVLKDYAKEISASTSGAPKSLKPGDVRGFYKSKYEKQSDSALQTALLNYVKSKLDKLKTTSDPVLVAFFSDNMARNYYSTNKPGIDAMLSASATPTKSTTKASATLSPSEEKLYKKFWVEVESYLRPTFVKSNTEKRQELVLRYKELDDELQKLLKTKQQKESKVVSKKLEKLESTLEPVERAYGVSVVAQEVTDFPYFTSSGLNLSGVLTDEKLKSAWKSLKPSTAGHYSDLELLLRDVLVVYGSGVPGELFYKQDVEDVVRVQKNKAGETTQVGNIFRRKEQKRDAGTLAAAKLQVKKDEAVVEDKLQKLLDEIENFRFKNLGDAVLPYPSESQFKSEMENSKELQELYATVPAESLPEFKKQLWRELMLPAHRENAMRAAEVQSLLQQKDSYEKFLKSAGVRSVVTKGLQKKWGEDEVQPTEQRSELTLPRKVVTPKKTGTEWLASVSNPSKVTQLFSTLDARRKFLGPKNQQKLDSERQEVLSRDYSSYEEFYSALQKKVSSLLKRTQKVLDAKKSEVLLDPSQRRQLVDNLKEGLGNTPLVDYSEIEDLMGASQVWDGPVR